MRAAVGYLTRNIQIIGSGELGCRIVILGPGSAILRGVEIINCGSADQAGLNFFSPVRITSYLSGSSLHDSNGPLFFAS